MTKDFRTPIKPERPTPVVLYRYDHEHEEGQDIRLYLSAFPVFRATPTGVWISRGRYARPKFVSLDAARKWAHVTVPDALADYQRRKTKHIQILRAQMETARECLRLAQDGEYPRVAEYIRDMPLELPKAARPKVKICARSESPTDASQPKN